MNHIQKKILSLLGVARLTLPSCGKKSEKIQISIGRWPASQLTQDVNRFRQWKTRFETDYSQYEIVPNTFEYSVASVQAKAQAHKLPTIFQTWFTEPNRLVTRGYIKDITSQLNELGWLDKRDPSRKDALTFDGKTYHPHLSKRIKKVTLNRIKGNDVYQVTITQEGISEKRRKLHD